MNPKGSKAINIALIGHTNAGKSTLFNRLLGNYRAIITDIPGTTRDLLVDDATLGGYNISIIDTPGLDAEHPDISQIYEPIADADIILFVISGRQGRVAMDDDILSYIRKNGKIDQTILCINKLNNHYDPANYDIALADYRGYGIDDVIGISGKMGFHIEALRDMIIDKLSKLGYKSDTNIYKNSEDTKGNDIDIYTEEDNIEDDNDDLYDSIDMQYSLTEDDTDMHDDDIVRVAIVGKPNAGKSTLTNKLVGKTISKVSAIPGTTLDYITGDFVHHIDSQDILFKLYDTAGIRKKTRYSSLETIAHAKTFKMLEYIKPISIVMIDSIEGITSYDLNVIGQMEKTYIPVIICFNKIDQVENIPRFMKECDKMLKGFEWIERCYISAQTGKGIDKLLKYIYDRYQTIQNISIKTSQINRYMQIAYMSNPPKFPQNKVAKYYYITCTSRYPLRFVFFVNDIERCNMVFKRRINNTLRKGFDLKSIPVEIDFRQRER